jgi:hypothetical protein
VRDEDFPDSPLVARALHRCRAREVRGGRLARSLEYGAEKVRIAFHRSGDDRARVEVHASFIVSLGRVNAQSSGFPAQIEQLENVVNAKLA